MSTTLGSYSENQISEPNISEKLAIANGLLQENNICSGLPSLQGDGSNASDVLSYTLTAIIHLCKCCKANSNLRNEAERSVHAANEELLRVKRLNEVKKEKISRLETKIATMKKQATDAEKEKKRIVAGLTTECNELKIKCARSTYRVNHLSLDVKKREREYSLLQQKVQTLMTNTKRLSIEPQIVAIVANNATKAPCISREESLEREEREYQDLVALSEDQCVNEVIAENRALRDLLLAVQEELDDLLISNPNTRDYSKTPARLPTNEHSPVDSQKAVGLKSDGLPYPEEESLATESTSNDTQNASPLQEDLQLSLQPSRQSSAEIRDQEHEHAEGTLEETTMNEAFEHCDGETPKTPANLKYDSEFNEAGGQRRSEGNDSHQASCQEEEFKSPASKADAEVGTPITGSSDRNVMSLNNLTPALSTEQMNLPFDMIRENLERSLDQKFELLRLAMQEVGRTGSPNATKA
ncbi:cingulin isoform X1 [Gracilaria domingensis]|nr:cingulin isoform X1 [Gracilaria domingensis]